MAWYDDLISALGLDQVGLDAPDYVTTIKTAAYSTPVTPSGLSDDDTRAWNLAHTASFATDGIAVAADGSLSKLAGWNPLAGATLPSTSPFDSPNFGTAGTVFPASLNPSGLVNSVGSAITSIAWGVGILLALVIVVEVVKR